MCPTWTPVRPTWGGQTYADQSVVTYAVMSLLTYAVEPLRGEDRPTRSCDLRGRTPKWGGQTYAVMRPTWSSPYVGMRPTWTDLRGHFIIDPRGR